MSEPSRVRCVLVVADGPSKRVGGKGVVIGRQKDCDLVALDPAVSRRHALVQLTGAGAEVVVLGRTGIKVNGKACDRVHDLANGDRIELPGLVLDVQIHVARVQPDAPATFQLERERGGSFGIVHSPFVLGGGDDDDLIIKKWPAGAVRLHVAQKELFVEIDGAMEPLAIDQSFSYKKEVFTVRLASTGRDATTAIGGLHDLPTRAIVELLPRGGRVVFTIGDGERAVYLADRQLDLVIALLRASGEIVADDALREIVWPRNPGVSRPEINMLISRCRKTFVEAGLAGPRLLVRAPGGGGTMIALAPNAEVTIA